MLKSFCKTYKNGGKNMNKEFILDLAKKIYAVDSPTGYTKEVIALLQEIAEDMG